MADVRAPVPLPVPEFATLQAYAAQFTRVETWEPYVWAICDRHGISGRILAADLAGTNPVFMIEPDDGARRCVVKLYETQLFDGERSCVMERAVYGLIAQHPHIPEMARLPVLLARGDLFGDGRWPYNVISHIPGHSLSQVADQLNPADRLNLATFLGRHLRVLHSLPTPPALTQAREPFREFLHAQHAVCEGRLREWGAVSPHLLDTLGSYLFDEASWDTALLEPTPRLIHADLNADHVLGQRNSDTGAWTPTGLIDFGDARVADRLYELVPLHLGLFQSDTNLLRMFMAAYGPDEDLQRDFVRRAMNFTLLFQFNALGWLAEARSASSWDALAARIWDYA